MMRIWQDLSTAIGSLRKNRLLCVIVMDGIFSYLNLHSSLYLTCLTVFPSIVTRARQSWFCGAQLA